MKKILLIIAAIIGIVTVTNAQSVFKRTDGVFNLGIGLDSYVGYNLEEPPISASFEYGVFDNVFRNGNGSIGIGAYIGYSRYTKSYRLCYTHFVVGPRVALHYGFMNELDTYIGLILGYRSISYGEAYNKEDALPIPGFAVNANVGVRYFFTSNFGGYLEAGYGVSNVCAGITFRI